MADDSHIHPSCDTDEPPNFFGQLDIQLLIHELKGPLSVIVNNNRMLLELQHRYGRLNESQETALKRALRSTAKLNDIIQSMLDVGSSESGQFTLSRFDIVHSTTKILVDLVESETCEPIGDPCGGDPDIAQRLEYLSANGILMNISPAVQGLILYQDEAKLGRILSNLVRNALQHKKSRVIVHLAFKKPYLELCVDDDGQGIAFEDQSGLFQCYTRIQTGPSQSRTKGHGLGLAGRDFWRAVSAVISRSTQSADPEAVLYFSFRLNGKRAKRLLWIVGDIDTMKL